MKKGMKSFAAFLLMAVMLMNTIPLYAFAAESEMTLTVSTVSGTPGEEVKVTIDVSNNPGLASLVFSVEYDSTLTLTNVEFNSAFGPYATTPPTYTNPQKITLISPLSDVTANGTLATLTFEISESAADGYSADIEISFAEKDIFNAADELIPTTVVNGKVSVFRGIAGDINSDRSVDTKDAILLFRYVAGWDVTVDPLAVDCNGDGDVDTKDAIALFRYVAGWPEIKLYYGTTCVHTLTFVAANESTCTEGGNVAYWHCSSCGGNYSDINGENKLDITVVPASGHAMQYNAEKTQTCTEPGNVEYWYCSNCELNFADEDGETVIGVTAIPADGHDLTKVSEQAATCTESGNVTYWFCDVCEKNFADEDATVELGDVTVSESGHKLSFVEAKEATHISDGNVAYWYCTACKCCFTDESASTEIADTVIPATGHGEMLEHVEAKESTVYEKGNDEYWYCPECDKYYSDSEAENEISKSDTVVGVVPYYTITFYDDKDWAEGHEVRFPQNKNLNLNTQRPPNYDGYEFNGWYTSTTYADSTKIDGIEAGNIKDLMLYANLTTKTYTITYHHAPINSNPETYTVNSAFKLAAPKWDGLIFSHWTDDAGHTITEIKEGMIGNIELEAHWISPQNYSVASTNMNPIVIVKPDDKGNNQELYYLVYEVGTVYNVLLDKIWDTYKYNANETYDEVHKKIVNVGEETAKTINHATTSSFVRSESFSQSTTWIKENSRTKNKGFTLCPEVEVEGIKLKLYEYEKGKEELETESLTEYEGCDTGISYGGEVSDEISSTTLYCYDTTTERERRLTLSPETSPAGSYTLAWAGDFKVYAIVTYDPYTEDYGINLYSISLKTYSTTFYDVLPEYNIDVDITVKNSLNYDIPLSTAQSSIIDASFYVEYDANGGEGEKMPMSIGSNDGSITLLPNTYTKPGYTFMCWDYIRGTSVGLYEDGDTITNPCESGATLTLKARWKLNVYDIDYVSNGGTISGDYTTSYTVESDSIVLPTPVYDTYPEYNHFVGWYVDESCTTEFTKEYCPTTSTSIPLYAKWDLCTVYTSIDSTPWSVSGRVIIDWRGESDTNLLNHTSRSVLSERYNNIDIVNSAKEVIFIGNPDQKFTNFRMHVCSFADGQKLTIRFVDFNFVTNESTAIGLYEDGGVELLIDISGKCSIGTSCPSGNIIDTPNNTVSIIGTGNLSIDAGDGSDGADYGDAGGSGGKGIIVDNLNITISGLLSVRGGHGGSGHDNKDDKMQANSKRYGGDGGAGGDAIYCNSCSLSGNITVTGGNGGDGGYGHKTRNEAGVGGDGGNGGNGISYSTSCSIGDTSAIGGTAGAGGDAQKWNVWGGDQKPGSDGKVGEKVSKRP